MACSSKCKKIYDVFLSFRGTDLRNSFVGHLYHALHRIGIRTFLDSEELKKGEQILMLMKAIEESCIAIIVFSKNYASSTWCLEEVAKIMECKEKNNLTVLPVFYKVEPSEVRGWGESYGSALTKQESKFGKDSEKVKRWKKVLFNVGSLSGWHLNHENESEFIQKIVKEISTRLGRTPLHVAQHPVGIDTQVVMLISMLNLESDNGILKVGLWGQGGIGKTTLAKAIYNSISRQFEGSCFLANVRETSKGCKGLVTLQEILLKDILLLQPRLEVSNEDEGIELIQHRLCCKKVLLILDDVDDYRQLYALAGEGNWFGDGSRIIVTTRDKHLLTCHEIHQNHVYEVKPLDYIEAYDLLRKHASLRHQELEIKKDLVEGVLGYAKGLPLALEVLGSFLRGRSKGEWESTLDKISKAPNKDINDVLKISYDGLEENEKEIFLHIACFFKGWNIEYVEEVLNNCNYKAVIGLQILTERALIRTEAEVLQMHDLIQMMGTDIVNQECDDPRGRSKLWLYDDVVDVLSSDVGDCAIKAIVLKLPYPKKLSIQPNAFKKMKRLRLLILHNLHNSFQGPLYLPNELRWIEWDVWGPGIPEFSSGPKKLVRLDMSNCNIAGVVKQSKSFHQLKYMRLINCKFPNSTPDVSCTPTLKELFLSNCKNLIEVHESITNHDNLRQLSLIGCPELSVFPNVLKSKNLENLEIHDCPKFDRFPDIPHKLEGLQTLSLERTAIKKFPISIENLVSLQKMSIRSCTDLVNFPSSIYKLQNLENLWMSNCPIVFPKYRKSADPHMKIGLPNLNKLNLNNCNLSRIEFLENLSCAPLLEILDLKDNNITSLPTSISKRNHLSMLIVHGNHQLQEIPEFSPFLDLIDAMKCDALQTNGYLTSIDHWVRRALTFVDWIEACSFTLPGITMPEWFQPITENCVSFRASKDLYDKFLGFVFCANSSKDAGPYEGYLYVDACYKGKRQGAFRVYGNPYNFDYTSLKCLPPSALWGEVDFGQSDGSYKTFSLHTTWGRERGRQDMKRWGFRIICKELEDYLKDEIRDNQLIDLALLHEIGHNSTDREAESSHMLEDSPIVLDLLKNFHDCQMSTEEHSQIGSKRNQEFNLPQGKRIKTMSTSNSTDAEEDGTADWLHL